MFLLSLDNAYKVNTTVLQSSENHCWTTDLTNLSNNFTKNLYFGKSLSPHIDPILPVDDKDSDDDIIITHYSKASTQNKCPADIKIDPGKGMFFSILILNLSIIRKYHFYYIMLILLRLRLLYCY